MSSIPKLYSSPDSTHSGYSSFSNLPIKSEHFDYSNTIFTLYVWVGVLSVYVCEVPGGTRRRHWTLLEPKLKTAIKCHVGARRALLLSTHVKLSEWLPASYWSDEGVCVLIHMLANSEKFTLKWSIIHLILGMKMCYISSLLLV